LKENFFQFPSIHLNLFHILFLKNQFYFYPNLHAIQQFLINKAKIEHEENHFLFHKNRHETKIVCREESVGKLKKIFLNKKKLKEKLNEKNREKMEKKTRRGIKHLRISKITKKSTQYVNTYTTSSPIKSRLNQHYPK